MHASVFAIYKCYVTPQKAFMFIYFSYIKKSFVEYRISMNNATDR